MKAILTNINDTIRYTRKSDAGTETARWSFESFSL